ncbi:copper amine oxidase N-terminal domain-containing protein [Cohnella zeiphila]|uniref:Copper amine oxidase N-terminal domain-containing protein n=1 Tax=Cohnella zeiphila TaxID=2761120 RepID=A0A7X0SQ56_9BACL|nr:copper amine oxidase N-terminal domain-containing protein [Cohnella zeiphila]MBB6733946.1 copper amine oxidase N-terminal domain-containing protein [Cohnella zeiphila]
MRKKWIAVLGTAIAVLAISSSVYASGSIKLVVNGHTVNSDTAPRVIDGRTMVPIRTAAEALGATVNWHSDTQTVTIDTNTGGGDQGQQQEIQLLQQALAPATADEAVQTWAESVKSRNGAAQYAVLSATLQGETVQTYKDLNWVTGLSSPWVASYDVSKPAQAANGSSVYTVVFKLADSTGDAGSGTVKVTVSAKDSKWFIGGLQMTDGADNLGGIVVVPGK